MESSFGAWMQQRRKMLDLTGEELAHLVGCSAGMIRMLEAGKRRPSKQIAELLADHLKIAPEQRSVFLEFARQLPADPKARLPAASRTESGAAHFKLSERPRPTNLSTMTTPLLGREWELATLRNRILRDDARLVTLVGPPGIGKTHLSIELARSLIREFEDGAFFVSLAPISDPELVAATTLHALGLTGNPNAPALMILRHALREKHMLLVLDNFEQVVAAAPLVAELLAECVWVKVIVTSREPLRLRVERQFAVPPLALPPLGGKGTAHADYSVESLNNYAAIALFVERAQAVDATFDLTDDNAAAVASICASLAGNPLGIALAASWANTLSCSEIAREIRRNLDFLTATMQDMPERHRSLRAAFDHSWKLLSEPERHALSELSVFRGGFEREAAEQIAGASLTVLSSLVSKSLLRRTNSDSGRYEMHETVRHYGEAKLRSDAQRSHDVDASHSAYFTHMLAQAEAGLCGPAQTETVALLRADADNVRVAWRWAVEAQRYADIRQSARVLLHYFRLTGQMREAHDVFAHASSAFRTYAQDPSEPSLEHAHTLGLLLTNLGYAHYARGEYGLASEANRQGLTLLREAGDRRAIADALLWRGMFVLESETVDNVGLMSESLSISREIGYTWNVAQCLNFLGQAAFGRSDWGAARRLFGESLALWRIIGDPYNMAYCLCFLGAASAALGRLDEAKMQLREGLALSHQVVDRWLGAFAQLHMGFVHATAGDLVEAEGLFASSLTTFVAVEDWWGQTKASLHLGDAHAVLGDRNAARTAYLQSLRLAHEHHNSGFVLHALIGLAEIANDAPSEALVWACELSFHVDRLVDSGDELRARSDRLGAHLAALISPSHLAARARAEERTLDALVAERLREEILRH